MKKIYTGGQADQLGAAATGGLGIVTLSFTYRVCAKLSRGGAAELCAQPDVYVRLYIYIYIYIYIYVYGWPINSGWKYVQHKE